MWKSFGIDLSALNLDNLQQEEEDAKKQPDAPFNAEPTVAAHAPRPAQQQHNIFGGATQQPAAAPAASHDPNWEWNDESEAQPPPKSHERRRSGSGRKASRPSPGGGGALAGLNLGGPAEKSSAADGDELLAVLEQAPQQEAARPARSKKKSSSPQSVAAAGLGLGQEQRAAAAAAAEPAQALRNLAVGWGALFASMPGQPAPAIGGEEDAKLDVHQKEAAAVAAASADFPAPAASNAHAVAAAEGQQLLSSGQQFPREGVGVDEAFSAEKMEAVEAGEAAPEQQDAAVVVGDASPEKETLANAGEDDEAKGTMGGTAAAVEVAATMEPLSTPAGEQGDELPALLADTAAGDGAVDAGAAAEAAEKAAVAEASQQIASEAESLSDTPPEPPSQMENACVDEPLAVADTPTLGEVRRDSPSAPAGSLMGDGMQSAATAQALQLEDGTNVASASRIDLNAAAEGAVDETQSKHRQNGLSPENGGTAGEEERNGVAADGSGTAAAFPAAIASNRVGGNNFSTDEVAAALEKALADAAHLRGALAAANTALDQQAAAAAVERAAAADAIASAQADLAEALNAASDANERTSRAEERVFLLEAEARRLAEMAASATEAARAARETAETESKKMRVAVETATAAAANADKQRTDALERVDRLQKERARMQQELDLQNARRKEMAEKARELEAQLAGADRSGRDRESEVEALRGRISELQGELNVERATAAEAVARYESLHANFKQVEGDARRAAADLESWRGSVESARAAALASQKEAEELRESVEDAEGARAALAAALAAEQERSRREIDALEAEIASRRPGEELARATMAAREDAVRQLEEYKLRAQNSLRKANEAAAEASQRARVLEQRTSELQTSLDEERAKAADAVARVAAAEASAAELAAKAESRGAVAAAEEAVSALQEAKTALTEAEIRESALATRLERAEEELAAARGREAQLSAELAAAAAAAAAAVAAAESAAGTAPAVVTAENLQKFVAAAAPADAAGGGIVHSGAVAAAAAAAAGRAPVLESNGQNGLHTLTADDSGFSMANLSVVHRADSAYSASDAAEMESAVMSEAGVEAGAGMPRHALLYVAQLERQCDRDKAELRRLVDELTALQRQLALQQASERRLMAQIEQFEGERRREETLSQGRDASVNLEYLKNIVVRYLQSSDPTERSRLLPVISTVLQFSSDEKAKVERAHAKMRAGPATGAAGLAAALPFGGGAWGSRR